MQSKMGLDQGSNVFFVRGVRLAQTFLPEQSRFQRKSKTSLQACWSSDK